MTKTVDVLCPGESLTWVCGMVERTANWYTVAYSYRDRRGGEYFATRKFMDIQAAKEWQRDAMRAINGPYTH